MFDINEHTALQSGRNHQQVNQKAATIVATVTLALLKASASILQKLIQGIINRLRGGKKDSSIEIKINDQLVFKGKVGGKPTVNKLSLNDLTAIIEPAIADSKQNLELLVKADNKIVYASNRGKVKLDQLDAFLQAAKNPKQKVAFDLEQGENEVNQPSTRNAPKITIPTNEQQGASNNTRPMPVEKPANRATSPTGIVISATDEKSSTSIASLEQWYSQAQELGKKPEYLNRVVAVINDFKEGKVLSSNALSSMQRDFEAHKQVQKVVINVRHLLQIQGQTVDETLYYKSEKYSLELQETVDKLTVKSPERGVIFSCEQGRIQTNQLDEIDFKAFEEIGHELKSKTPAKQLQDHAYNTKSEEEEIER